jgi:hypothetical protein
MANLVSRSFRSFARASFVDAVLLDDRRGEVEDLLELARRDVEQVADAARDALEEPDVADRSGRSMWPIRSRRTFCRVTSTPQRSQMMPL